MCKKSLYLFLLLCYSSTFAQVFEGVYQAYDNTKEKPYDKKMTIVYDSIKKCYYGEFVANVRDKKRTFNRPNQIIFLARAEGNLLEVQEIAAPMPQNNYIPNPNNNGPKLYSNVWNFTKYKFVLDNAVSRKLTHDSSDKNNAYDTYDYTLDIDKVSAEDKKRILSIGNGLVVENLKFTNENDDGIFKDQSNALVTYTITNKTNYVFRNIYTEMSFPNDTNQSVYFTIRGDASWKSVSFDVSVFPNQRLENKIYISSKFDLPYKTLQIKLDLITNFSNIATILDTYILNVKTSNFVKTIETVDADWKSQRLQLIGSYYGMSNYKYDISKELKKLGDAGDVKAKVWEGIFTYYGQAGFEQDEQLAFYKARSNSAFDEVSLLAESGDVEAIYLASIGYKIGIRGKNTKAIGENLFEKTLKKEFAPALFNIAVQRISENKKNDAKYYLEKCIEKGISIANFQRAKYYEEGAVAFASYEKLAKMGYPDAQLMLSELYSKGTGVAKDVAKSINYLKAAASTNSYGKIALANVYLADKATFALGVKLKREAASQGNRDAMFELGLMYLYDKNLEIRNSREGIELIKKSAELGQAQSMNLLGILYSDGKLMAGDKFLSRYWINQAATKGVGQALNETLGNATNGIVDFFSGVMSYKPSSYYEVVDQYNNVLKSGYADDGVFSHIVWGGLTNMFAQSRKQRQEIIDDIRLIYSRNNISTYGGIISSKVRLPFRMKTNYLVDIYASGKVSLGSVAGIVGPEGLQSDYMFKGSSLDSNINHGAVIMGGEGSYTWNYVGKSSNGIFTKTENNILLAVNDADYINNSGYFDIKVDMFDLNKVKIPDPKIVENVKLLKQQKGEYLKQMKKNAITADKGITYAYIKKGNGKKPVKGETIYFNNWSYLSDGTMYNTTVEKDARENNIYEVGLAESKIYNPMKWVMYNMRSSTVGFLEAVNLLNHGDRILVFIPSQLGYGEKGVGKIIPPNSDLIFEFEMLDNETE